MTIEIHKVRNGYVVMHRDETHRGEGTTWTKDVGIALHPKDAVEMILQMLGEVAER